MKRRTSRDDEEDRKETEEMIRLAETGLQDWLEDEDIYETDDESR